VGEPLRIGIVGLGMISKQYLATMDQLESVRLTTVADVNEDLARSVAAERPGVEACSVAQLVTSPEVDLVLNLTIPAAHSEIALAAIGGGKSVYGEKPFAVNTKQGSEMLAAAEAAGVMLGCAPDTVLGTGIQTARQVIDDDLIGAPVAATATMVVPGHERWHLNPDFYYQPGGGPLMDMGPYYLTALVTLLGPVTAVMGAASRTRSTRIIGTGPRAGQAVPVDIDTHITGVLTHESGALSTMVMSFDAVKTQSANIEIHGETGSMVVPDPNHFAGDVQIHKLGDDSWQTVPVSAGYLNAGRGVGIADLAATPPGSEPRAGAALAYHVLDIMETLLAATATSRSTAIESTVTRPSAVPLQTMR